MPGLGDSHGDADSLFGLTRREIRDRERALLYGDEPAAAAPAAPAMPSLVDGYAALLNSLAMPTPDAAPLSTAESFVASQNAVEEPAAPAAPAYSTPAESAPSLSADASSMLGSRRSRRAADEAALPGIPELPVSAAAPKAAPAVVAASVAQPAAAAVPAANEAPVALAAPAGSQTSRRAARALDTDLEPSLNATLPLTPLVAAASVDSAQAHVIERARAAAAAQAEADARAQAQATAQAHIAAQQQAVREQAVHQQAAPFSFDLRPAAATQPERVEAAPAATPPAAAAPAIDTSLFGISPFTESNVFAAEKPSRRAPELATPGPRRSSPGSTPTFAPATALQPPVTVAKAPLGRRIATKAFAFAAMSIVALMAVATSVPADALLTADDVKAAAFAAQMPKSDDEPGQTIGASGVDSISVQADGYASTTVAEAAAASGIRMESTFVNNPNGTVQWPFLVGVHVGDRFGYRNCAGCSSDHGGQDFNPGDGAQIQAIADGVVSVAVDGEGSLGVHMMIDHVIDGRTVTSVYAHMQHGTMQFKVGDTVKVGQYIGNTGNTGQSTGPHLHFEIRIGGVGGTKVDPLDWLYANTN